MPVTAPRCTFEFFNSIEGRGWSETLWVLGTQGTLSQFQTIAFTLAQARVQLLADSCTLEEIRLSDDAVIRDAFLVPPPTPGISSDGQTTYGKGLVALPPAPAAVSFNLRLFSNTFYWGPVFLRGVPNGYMPGLTRRPPTAPPAYQTSLDAYYETLTKGGNTWGISVLPKAPADGVLVAVQNISYGANNVVTVTAAGINLGVPTPVRINGVKIQKPGRFSVSDVIAQPVNANSFTLIYPRTYPGLYLSGGNVQVVPKKIVAITSVYPVGTTGRKTGRNFDQPRGRALTR
jgi:hypothetical protein